MAISKDYNPKAAYDYFKEIYGEDYASKYTSIPSITGKKAASKKESTDKESIEKK